MKRMTDVEQSLVAHAGLVPVAVAASYVGVSKQRIHELIRKGKLETVRLEGYLLVGWGSLRRWACTRERTIHRAPGQPVPPVACSTDCVDCPTHGLACVWPKCQTEDAA